MNTSTAKPFDEAATGRAARLRRWLGLSRPPSSRRLRPIRRRWLAATLQARTAVLARTPLEDYLRARLAQYLVKLPVSRAVLPLQVEVAGGEILTTSWNAPGAADDAPAHGDGEGWASALVSLEGPSVLREFPELEARMATLDHDGAAALRRVEELSRRLEQDLAGGAIAPIPPPEQSAEQLGRPSVRSPAAQLALTVLAFAVVVAQAWSIAVPALTVSGHYPAALSGPFRPEMLEGLLTCAFALGVALGLLALAFTALGSADAFARSVPPARRRRAQAAGLLGGLAGAAAAAAAATLPAPRSGLPPAGHAILLLSLSGGAALLLHRARRWRDERALELAAALAWDRGRARVLGDRTRRMEELAWAKRLVEEIDRRRERTRRSLERLAERASAAAMLVAAAREQGRIDRDRLARSLVGALELDRYEFLRQASARGATDLLPGRKPGAEERPPLGAEDLSSAESGRMAG